jgi:hypothetical protein
VDGSEWFDVRSPKRAPTRKSLRAGARTVALPFFFSFLSFRRRPPTGGCASGNGRRAAAAASLSRSAPASSAATPVPTRQRQPRRDRSCGRDVGPVAPGPPRPPGSHPRQGHSATHPRAPSLRPGRRVARGKSKTDEPAGNRAVDEPPHHPLHRAAPRGATVPAAAPPSVLRVPNKAGWGC